MRKGDPFLGLRKKCDGGLDVGAMARRLSAMSGQEVFTTKQNDDGSFTHEGTHGTVEHVAGITFNGEPLKAMTVLLCRYKGHLAKARYMPGGYFHLLDHTDNRLPGIDTCFASDVDRSKLELVEEWDDAKHSSTPKHPDA
jgi:hypothetical protein